MLNTGAGTSTVNAFGATLPAEAIPNPLMVCVTGVARVTELTAVPCVTVNDEPLTLNEGPGTVTLKLLVPAEPTLAMPDVEVRLLWGTFTV